MGGGDAYFFIGVCETIPVGQSAMLRYDAFLGVRQHPLSVYPEAPVPRALRRKNHFGTLGDEFFYFRRQAGMIFAECG